MTTTSATEAERLAALAALAIGQEPPTTVATPARIVPTGREVYAGGDVPRLLVAAASLAYREGGRLRVADAQLGDTVLLSPAQASRLDDLAATVDVDATEAEVAEVQQDAEVSDEQLAAMKAADLVAYVTQHPDQRARVRELEVARVKTSRKGSGPRATILSATEPTEELDDVAARQAAAAQAADVDALDALVEDTERHALDDAVVAGTADEADPVRDRPHVEGTLIDPLATIGTPDRPAGLNLP